MSKGSKRPPTAEVSEEVLEKLRNSDQAKNQQKLVDEKLAKNDLPAGSIKVYQPWSACNFEAFEETFTNVEPDCLTLPIEDFPLFGRTPHDELILVVCHFCQRSIKASLFSQHLEIKHREEKRQKEAEESANPKGGALRTFFESPCFSRMRNSFNEFEDKTNDSDEYDDDGGAKAKAKAKPEDKNKLKETKKPKPKPKRRARKSKAKQTRAKRQVKTGGVETADVENKEGGDPVEIAMIDDNQNDSQNNVIKSSDLEILPTQTEKAKDELKNKASDPIEIITIDDDDDSQIKVIKSSISGTRVRRPAKTANKLENKKTDPIQVITIGDNEDTIIDRNKMMAACVPGTSGTMSNSKRRHAHKRSKVPLDAQHPPRKRSKVPLDAQHPPRKRLKMWHAQHPSAKRRKLPDAQHPPTKRLKTSEPKTDDEIFKKPDTESFKRFEAKHLKMTDAKKRQAEVGGKPAPKLLKMSDAKKPVIEISEQLAAKLLNMPEVKKSDENKLPRTPDAAKQPTEILSKVVNASEKIDLSNKTDNNANKKDSKKPVFTVLKGNYCGGQITKANQVQPSSSPAAIYSAHPSVSHNSVFKKPYPIPKVPSDYNMKSSRKPNSNQTSSMLQPTAINKPGTSQISVNNSVITGDLNTNRAMAVNSTQSTNPVVASPKVSAKDSKRKSPPKPKMSFAEKFNVAPGLFQKLNPDLVLKNNDAPVEKLESSTPEPTSEQPQQPQQEQKTTDYSNKFPIASSSILIPPQPRCSSDKIQQVTKIVDSETESPKAVSPAKPGKKKSEKFCRNRQYDPDRHCGVRTKTASSPCVFALTCRAHSVAMRRLVPGRSEPFDQLLQEYKANNSHKIRKSSKSINESSDKNTNKAEDKEVRRKHIVRPMFQKRPHVFQPTCTTIVDDELLAKIDSLATKIAIVSPFFELETLLELNCLVDIELRKSNNSAKSFLKYCSRMSFIEESLDPIMITDSDLSSKDQESQIRQCDKSIDLNKQDEKVLVANLKVSRSNKINKNLPPIVLSSYYAKCRKKDRIQVTAIHSEINSIRPKSRNLKIKKTNPLPVPVSRPKSSEPATNVVPLTSEQQVSHGNITTAKSAKMLKDPLLSGTRIIRRRFNPNANIGLDQLDETLDCPEQYEESNPRLVLEQTNVFGNNYYHHRAEYKDELDTLLGDYLKDANDIYSLNLIAGKTTLGMKKVFTSKRKMHHNQLLSGRSNICPMPNREVMSWKDIVEEHGGFLDDYEDCVNFCFNNPALNFKENWLKSLEKTPDKPCQIAREAGAKVIQRPYLPDAAIRRFPIKVVPPTPVPVAPVPVFSRMNQPPRSETLIKPVPPKVPAQNLSTTTAGPSMHKNSSDQNDSDSDLSIPDDVVEFLLEHEEKWEAKQKQRKQRSGGNKKPTPPANPVWMPLDSNLVQTKSSNYAAGPSANSFMPPSTSFNPSILATGRLGDKSAYKPKQPLQPKKVASTTSIPQPPKQFFTSGSQTIGPSPYIIDNVASSQNRPIPVPKQRLTNQRKTLLAQQQAVENVKMLSQNRPITLASNPTILSNAGGSAEPATFTAILCGPNDVRLQYDPNRVVDNARPGTNSGTVGSHQMIAIPISNDQQIMIPMNVSTTGQASLQLNAVASTPYHQQNTANVNAHPRLAQMLQPNPPQNRMVGNVIALQPQPQSQPQQLNTIQCATLSSGTTQAILLPISSLNSMQNIYILNPSGDTVNALSINPSSASLNTMIGVPASNIHATATVAKSPVVQLPKHSLSPMGSSTTTTMNAVVPQNRPRPQNPIINNHPELLQQLLSSPTSSTASTSAKAPMNPVRFIQFPFNPK